MLKNITEEERAEMLEKARVKREEKKEYAKKHLRLICASDSHWAEIAKKYDYRLPQRVDKAAAKHVNRFLKRFGLDKGWYVDHTGYRNGNEESENNPCMSAREQVGLLLEAYNDDNGELK